MTNRPLDGVRITDFCWIGAGSYTTKLLADMGADVLKIESSSYLDSLRLSAPYKDKIPGVNRSGYFADRNTSKRSVAINLKNPKGVELIRQLIGKSDVVSNNFTPGVMEKFGLGYEAVREIRPNVIYLSMSMQGSDGPERDTLGYGLTIGALSGVQYLTGLPGRDPAGTGTNFPDHIPNPGHAAFVLLAALRHRRRTGQGQSIDMAQIEATVVLFGPALMDVSANGHVQGPCGNDLMRASPHGVYPCKGDDRWIAIAVTNRAQWSAVADLLGLQDEAAARGWDRATLRYRDRVEVDAAVAGATQNWDAVALMKELQQRGVAAGVVQDASDVVEKDPQLEHRHHWCRLDHAEMGPIAYNAPPFRFASRPVGPRASAPLLGEHTKEVCRELLGLDDQAIATLTAEGVLT